MKNILRDFSDTYSESSVSENGVNFFAKGGIAKNINNQIDRFEMYKSNKYIAMTDNFIGDCRKIVDKQYKLNVYYKNIP